MADILVVEDDIDIRADLTEVLRERGHDVFAVSDGAKALARLKEKGGASLILLDLTMPGMNGWDFRKVQMRDPQLANIPVVILSGNEAIAQEASAMSVAGYIQKPYSLEALVETTERLVGTVAA
jgi:CheY-like chemotaxis protein